MRLSFVIKGILLTYLLSSTERPVYCKNRPPERQLIRIKTEDASRTPGPIQNSIVNPPSIYLLNPTSIVKPHALQHLHLDAQAYDADLVILTETWMKSHPEDSAVSLPGYTLFRRDRKKQRGGGVAVYVRNHLKATILQHTDLYEH